MGVPILRGGRVIGMLDVQNRTHRDYIDEEVENLQTVAMVLAELIAGDANANALQSEASARDERSTNLLRIEGILLSKGLGMGRAFLHSSRVNIEKMVANDPALEHERLQRAFSDM